ncbi:hypothetical protein [Streptomyces angustmyceticus]|uniref:hypothetical protein n=1 Tax=Streptomyces angustmyceticus TaxID=285578 RepID=UPI00381A0386
MGTEGHHDDRQDQLLVPLAAEAAAELGTDGEQLAALLGTVLHGLAQLRAGTTSVDGLSTTLSGTTALLERLEGWDAAVREHAAQGGSYGALAKATSVTRATAQSRRDTLLKKDPSAMAQWATGSS